MLLPITKLGDLVCISRFPGWDRASSLFTLDTKTPQCLQPRTKPFRERERERANERERERGQKKIYALNLQKSLVMTVVLLLLSGIMVYYVVEKYSLASPT